MRSWERRRKRMDIKAILWNSKNINKVDPFRLSPCWTKSRAHENEILFPAFPSFLLFFSFSFSTVRRRFCVKSFPLKGSFYTNNCTLPSETDKQQSIRGKRRESVTESTKWGLFTCQVTVTRISVDTRECWQMVNESLAIKVKNELER